METADKFEGNLRKSSYSGTSANCVEVGQGPFELILIRDSKADNIGQLIIADISWRKFIAQVKEYKSEDNLHREC